jgi:hypothetical protein
MREHRTTRRFVLWAALLLYGSFVIAGCVPQELTGPDVENSGDSGGNGNGTGDDDPPPPPPPPPDPRFTFAISASPEDPFVSVAEPQVGAYDLYLWLVCANAGVFMVQADLPIAGDALIGEGFTPDPGVVGIDWDEYGEFIVSLVECDHGSMRLGAFHFWGEGEGVAVNLQSDAGAGRAIPCGASEGWRFASRGFASDGSEPGVVGAEHGCEEDAPALVMDAPSEHSSAAIPGGAR